MLSIDCPFCGPRAQPEFVFGGASDLARPEPPDAATDEQWGQYLFYRDNPKGEHLERWCHRAGCGLWFNVLRDTMTHRIAGTARFGESIEAMR